MGEYCTLTSYDYSITILLLMHLNFSCCFVILYGWAYSSGNIYVAFWLYDLREVKMKTDILNIRFLRQGLVEAKKPDNFEAMTDLEKRGWADNRLSILDDSQIVLAMADFDEPSTNGYFDACPDAEAIEEKDGAAIVSTLAWDAFSDPDYGENVRQENRNMASYLNMLGFSSEEINTIAQGCANIPAYDMVRILDRAKQKAKNNYREKTSRSLIKKIHEDPSAPDVLRELLSNNITYIGFEKVVVSEDYMPDHCMYIYLSGEEDILIGIQTNDTSTMWKDIDYEYSSYEITGKSDFHTVINDTNILDRVVDQNEGHHAYEYLLNIKSTLELADREAFRDYILKRDQ